MVIFLIGKAIAKKAADIDVAPEVPAKRAKNSRSAKNNVEAVEDIPEEEKPQEVVDVPPKKGRGAKKVAPSNCFFFIREMYSLIENNNL